MLALSLLLVAVLVLTIGEMSGLARSSTVNAPPRLSNLTARIGTVDLEGGGTKRGVKGTYRLCDDGPQNSPGRFGLESITHRWKNGAVSLLVRERYPSMSWDIYFGKPECRAMIIWSSTIPADLQGIRGFVCYSVALRVRDPGGKWSNIVTRQVKKCPRP